MVRQDTVFLLGSCTVENALNNGSKTCHEIHDRLLDCLREVEAVLALRRSHPKLLHHDGLGGVVRKLEVVSTGHHRWQVVVWLYLEERIGDVDGEEGAIQTSAASKDFLTIVRGGERDLKEPMGSLHSKIQHVFI